MSPLLLAASLIIATPQQQVIQGIEIRPQRVDADVTAWGYATIFGRGAQVGFIPLVLPAGSIISSIDVFAVARETTQKLRVAVRSYDPNTHLVELADNSFNSPLRSTNRLDFVNVGTVSNYIRTLSKTLVIEPDFLYFLEFYTHPANSQSVWIGHIKVVYETPQ